MMINKKRNDAGNEKEQKKKKRTQKEKTYTNRIYGYSLVALCVNRDTDW